MLIFQIEKKFNKTIIISIIKNIGDNFILQYRILLNIFIQKHGYDLIFVK